MKRIIPLLVSLLCASAAHADWRFNPYTQRQDYFEATSDLKLSTASLRSDLNSEIARAIGAEGALAGDIATEISDRAAGDAALAAKDASIILSTGALDLAKVNRSGDTMTGPLVVNSAITSNGITVGASTSTVYCFPNGSCINGWYLNSEVTFFLTSYNSDVAGYKLMISSVPTYASASTTTIALTTTETVISSFIPPIGAMAYTLIPDGRWRFHGHVSVASVTGTKAVRIRADTYTRTKAGVRALVGSSELSPVLETVAADTSRTMDWPAPQIIKATDTRVEVLFVAIQSGVGTDNTINVYRDNDYYSSVIMPRVPLDTSDIVKYNNNTEPLNMGSYALTTSSDVVAHAYYGDGSHLTGISASASLVGVRYSTDPVSTSLIDLSTVTAAIANASPNLTGVRYSTDPVSVGLIDLSTVTTALASKLDYPVFSPVSLGSYALTTSSDVVAHAYYGDGSHLTGLTGGGDMVLAATQTVTGAKTFVADVTVSSITMSSGTVSTEVIFSTASSPTGMANKGVIYFSTNNVFMVKQGDGIDRPIVDPPGNWTCTIRSSAGTCSPLATTAIKISGAPASCSGNEKLISSSVDAAGYTTNACSTTANGPLVYGVVQSYSGQAATGSVFMTGASGTYGKVFTYVNCCQ